LFFGDHFDSSRALRVNAPADSGEVNVDFPTRPPVRSILLVSSSAGGVDEDRLGFQIFFASQWEEDVQRRLAGQGELRGNSVAVWDLFPSGSETLSSSLWYLKIHQDILVYTPPGCPVYKAAIEYWVYFY